MTKFILISQVTLVQ